MNNKKIMTLVATSEVFQVPIVLPTDLGYTGTNIPLIWGSTTFPSLNGQSNIFSSAGFTPYFKNLTIEEYKVELSNMQGARFGCRKLTVSTSSDTVGYLNKIAVNVGIEKLIITLDSLNEWEKLEQTYQLANDTLLTCDNYEANVQFGGIGAQPISTQHVESLGVNIDFRNVQTVYQNTNQFLKVSLKISYNDAKYDFDNYGNA